MSKIQIQDRFGNMFGRISFGGSSRTTSSFDKKEHCFQEGMKIFYDCISEGHSSTVCRAAAINETSECLMSGVSSGEG
jgi:hypothetical protein